MILWIQHEDHNAEDHEQSDDDNIQRNHDPKNGDTCYPGLGGWHSCFFGISFWQLFRGGRRWTLSLTSWSLARRPSANENGDPGDQDDNDYENVIPTWSLCMTTVWAFPPMLQWTSSVTRTRILSALRGRWKDEKAKWRKNKRKGLTLWQWRAPRRVHRLDPLRRGRRGRPQGRSCSACAAQPGCNVNFIQQNFYALLLFFTIFLPLKTHRV